MKLTFHATHALDLTTLKQRIGDRVRHLDTRYPQFEINKHYRWVSERVAEGEYRGGHGRVELGDDTIDAELELPFFARLFRARIESFVRRELAGVVAGERASRFPSAE